MQYIEPLRLASIDKNAEEQCMAEFIGLVVLLLWTKPSSRDVSHRIDHPSVLFVNMVFVGQFVFCSLLKAMTNQQPKHIHEFVVYCLLPKFMQKMFMLVYMTLWYSQKSLEFYFVYRFSCSITIQ